MALLRRQLLAPIFGFPNQALLVLLVCIGVASTRCMGQISESEPGHSSATVFLTIGGENTQLRYDADNALGFDTGFGYQPRKLLGFETRIASYPYRATFVQTPMTGGYRVGSDSLFGFPYAPFAYVGAGISRSQSEGPGRAALPAVFHPCLQADIGFDRTYPRFSWRMVQFSFRETYGTQQAVRSIGLSTGIVYRMTR